MTNLSLTRKAAAGLYANACSLLISANIVRAYRAYIPSCFSVFVLHPCGLISCFGEKPKQGQTTISFIGLPYGLFGLVLTKSYLSIAHDFLAFAAEQKPAVMPALVKVPRFGFLGRRALLQELNSLLATNFVKNQTTLSRLQRQLVAMRTKNEELWFGFEKARRMIVGMGFSTRNICFDLPAGSKTIGPKSKDTDFEYSQVLPVDLASFSGLSLYVSRVAPDNAAGSLQVVIRRRSDASEIASATIQYTALKTGWHYFPLPEVISRSFGDGILQLVWQGKNGPAFALADVKAERFGSEEATSLAMRIERGLAEPLLDTGTESYDPSMVRTILPPRALMEQGIFVGGTSAEEAHSAELGADVLHLGAGNRWLQTHVLAEHFSGLYLPNATGTATRRVTAEVTLDHAQAAPCLVVLMAVPRGADHNQLTDKMRHEYFANTLKPSGHLDGVAWTCQPLGAGCTELVQLSFEIPVAEPHDLVFGVLPLERGKNGRGWCRWHSITIAKEMPLSTIPAELTQKLELGAQGRLTQIRAHRFPEIADRIVYYRGQQAHIDERDALGYWPVEFSDDTGAMQLNPKSMGICAAVLKSGLPENTVRVSCEVGTAHKQAPSFIYIIGTYPLKMDVSSAVEKIANQVSGGKIDGVEGDGIVWASRTVTAQEKTALELRLNAPVGSDVGAFFAVIPSTKGDASYGWCRWYMLAFEMAPQNTPVTPLTLAEPDEVTR